MNRLRLVLAAAILWLVTAGVAQAQQESLAVTIEWPNEGETLYAGPSSLLYKIPVRGRVAGIVGESESYEVTLELFSGGRLAKRATVTPQADGSFEFSATVNPDGPVEQFAIAFAECGYACHSPGVLELVPGPLLLRVRVRDPAGRQASTERQMTVDISGTAAIPVRVVRQSDPTQAVENVTVSASAWLYLWRARFGSGLTSSSGLAQVQVEALSQAPTEYLLKVDPAVVDGVQVTGTGAVRVTVPPGASSVPPITLEVTTRSGRITGQVVRSDGRAPGTQAVRAIRLPGGRAYEATTDDQGHFEFPDLPLDRYLLALDSGRLMAEGAICPDHSLDLVESPEGSLELAIRSVPGATLLGQVTGEEGPLPFGWVTAGKAAASQPVLPGRDGFILAGLENGPVTVQASAPGYYSQAKTLTLPDAAGSGIEFTLIRQEDTETRSWGDGHLLLPPESKISRGERFLALQSGWLWGRNGVSEPLTVEAGSVELSLSTGRFALEYLPGRQGWFYLFEGQALARREGSSEPLAVMANQMVNLRSAKELEAVTLDPVVVAAMHAEETTPLAGIWEPTLSEQVRQFLAGLGLGAAQVITFVTYFLVFLSIILGPVLALYSWRRRRRKAEGL